MDLHPPVRQVDYLLIGGGVASATAAETLRRNGAEGSIVIVSAEDHLPYHRPPLSASLLKPDVPAEERPVLKRPDCRLLDIEILQGVRATGLHAGRRRLQTDKAGLLVWLKLLIATGVTPLRLQVPGADRAGILYLRTIADARAIQAAARKSRRCVIVGASFIGMEVASALRQDGLEVSLLTGDSGVFGSLRDPAITEFFTGLYAARGVEVVTGVAARFDGRRSVNAVVLEDGRRLPCNFVVVGIGARPELDFLHDSGIELGDGVVVDPYLQTSAPDVYAAGDVASFLDPVFNRRRRIEHWDNAIRQGRLAALNMLGQRQRYDEVSSFFCRVFDVNFQFAGSTDEAPRRLSLGSPQDGAWARLYLKDSVPRGLFTMGRAPRETAAIRDLIRYRTNIGRFEGRMHRRDFVFGSIPSQTVLVLQGGGAMGAFECGAIKALEERREYPDIVAGVSIGAFNGAIVASHPRHAAEALESFWNDLAVSPPLAGDERSRQFWSSMFIAAFGVQSFFKPRWMACHASMTDWMQPWTSFYDHRPARELLLRYVDFDALKSSPVRLLVSAVNVETAELEIFDSYAGELTIDHLLASASLPPGLPWTTIGGRHYWDGGIVSNSPLEQVAERCGAAGKRVVIVDLFPNARPLPDNLLEVFSRRDEIVYSERIRNTTHDQQPLHDARRLAEAILSVVDEATAARIRQLPPYVQVMGSEAPTIIRIVRESASGEPAWRDFDFSLPSIRALMRDGLEAGRRALRSGKAGPAPARAARPRRLP